MTQNILERLAATNPDAEIWWDSSPLIFPSWKAETLAKAPEGQRAEWEAQLTRLYDDATIQAQGTMGFRGVTTNPPLSLQAIKLAPQLWADEIRKIAKQNPALDYEGVYWTMYLDLVKKGAAAIRPVWEKSGGKYGFLSGQVDPRFVRDGEKMLAQGLQIAAQGPNVMVKLPGSQEGYQMLEELANRTSEVRFPEPVEGLQPSDAANQFRSVDPHVFVVSGICSRAGCPLIAFEPHQSDLLPGGGFLCTNDRSRFDAAGRVYPESAAPVDLLVPPHFYLDNNLLVIGESHRSA